MSLNVFLIFWHFREQTFDFRGYPEGDDFWHVREGMFDFIGYPGGIFDFMGYPGADE